MTVFVTVKKFAFIVLSVLFFQPSTTMILIVLDSSIVFSSVCLSEAAVCVFLDIIDKISFVDVTVCIFEDTPSVFLAIFELSFKMTSITIGQSSFSIEITSVEITLILIALLSLLECDQNSIPIELTRPESAIVLHTTFLFQLTLALKFVVFEVSSVVSPIWMLVLSIS